MINILILAAALTDTNSISAMQQPDSTYEKIDRWIDTTMPDDGSDNYDREVSKDFLRLKWGRHQSPIDNSYYDSPFTNSGDLVYANDYIAYRKERII